MPMKADVDGSSGTVSGTKANRPENSQSYYGEPATEAADGLTGGRLSSLENSTPGGTKRAREASLSMEVSDNEAPAAKVAHREAQSVRGNGQDGDSSNAGSPTDPVEEKSIVSAGQTARNGGKPELAIAGSSKEE